jgi:hypothetical protein
MTDSVLEASASLALAMGGTLVVPSEIDATDPEIFWEMALTLIKSRCQKWDNPKPVSVKNAANWYGDRQHNQLIPPVDQGMVYRIDEPIYLLLSEALQPDYKEVRKANRSRKYLEPSYGPWSGIWRASHAVLFQLEDGCIDKQLLSLVEASSGVRASHPKGVAVIDLGQPANYQMIRVQPIINGEQMK